jgi:hypothetical protein
MQRRWRDVFADEPTTPYDPANVPVPVAMEGDDTRPVDVGEMEGAARRSCEINEPHDPTPIAAPRASPNARQRAFVDLVIAGAGAVVTLPVHQVSITGLVLTVPAGTPLELASETAVTAVVHLMRGPEEHTRARLPAHVSHHRSASAVAAGGLSLRWDLREPGARRAVEALLAPHVGS